MNTAEKTIIDCMNCNLCTYGSENISCDLSCSKCDDDLAHILGRIKNINITNFIKHMKEYNIGPVGTCAICGKNYVYGGRNPRPVIKDENARCCHICYDNVVVPALDAASFVNGQKSKIMELSPKGIVQFVQTVGTAKLTSAMASLGGPIFTYNIVDAEYKAPMIIFKQAESDEVVTIDKSKICRSSARGGEIIIVVKGQWDHWTLCVDDGVEDKFNFYSYDGGKLEPHEIRACLMRAAELESYINDTLGINEDSKFRIYVHLRNNEQVLEEKNNADDSKCSYDYKFEIIVGSNDNQSVTYTDGIFISFKDYGVIYSPIDIMKELSLGLIQKLLPFAR